MNLSQEILLILLFSLFSGTADGDAPGSNFLLLLVLLLSLFNNESSGCGCNNNRCGCNNNCGCNNGCGCGCNNNSLTTSTGTTLLI